MEEDFSEYEIIFKSVQSGAIRTLIESLKEVLTDVNISFDNESMKIVTLDGTKVAVIHLKLVATSFVIYKCDRPEENPYKIGVCMASLHKLLKISGNNDTITMFVKKNDTSRLKIVIRNKNKKTKINSNLKFFN